MESRKIMLIGEKESFLIRVLMKKITEAGFEPFFAVPKVNAIAAGLEKADLVTYYLDNAEKVKPDIMHYLGDRLSETGKRMILIGEKNDAEETMRYIAGDLILATFIRPLEADKYIKAVTEEITAVNSGINRKSILIIDDDPTFLGMIRGWLKNDYKVAMATSGAQGIQWLGANKADLILLDYEMPVVSGPQVLEMLRSETAFANIPVFFLTGKSDKESVMKVLSLKPQNYLLKSIGREQLLEQLAEFFNTMPAK